MKLSNPFKRHPKRQRGIVMLLIVVALTSVLGLAGLALDFGVAFLTKSRIQNALDAAALAGAKVLKATGNLTQARTDAQTAFNYYLGQLNRPGGLTPTIEFSASIAPGSVAFGSTASPPNFIRVRMPAGYTIPTYLTRILPGASGTLELSGSAVAGPVRLEPTGEICNLAPIVVHATPPAPGAAIDTDCTDQSCFGYTIGQSVDLKSGTTAGPGNFNLLRLNGNGGDVVRDNLAGAFNGCVTLGDDVETQTGVLNGPFQGIDTRFDLYTANLSRTQFPPDVNTNNFATYAAYRAAVASGSYTDPAPVGVPGRRIIRVVFSDFGLATPVDGGDTGKNKGKDNTNTGNSMIPVAGTACFFLKRPSEGTGNDQFVAAEFTNDCPLPNGVRSNSSLDNLGEAFKIVLYKDPDSRES